MHSCTMSSLQVPFDTCDLIEVSESASSVNNFEQQYSASTDFNQAQLSHLIYISASDTSDLTISSNTFTDNVLHSSLIKVDSTGTTTVSGNYFDSNGAILGATVLDLRQCGTAYIRSNEFSYNSGCSGTGTVLVQCTADSSSFEYSEMYDTYTLVDGSTPTADTSVELDSNSFTGNVIGKDKHVVSIEGISTVSISSDTFTSNENYLPQIFNHLSPLAPLITSQPTTVTSLDNYDYKAQAILRVACSTSLSLSSVTFTANWIADHQSYFSDYQGIFLV